MFHRKFADNTNLKSTATKLRQKRFQLFSKMILNLPGIVNVLDVGGTQRYWEMMDADLFIIEKVHVTLLNTELQPRSLPNFISLVGDGRAMSQFENAQFDLVHSNSTIEHVGTLSEQKKMADEVRRVGKHYFVQTPNRFFPIEPHFVFPFFQFLPIKFRVWLVRHFKIGWFPKITDYQKALTEVKNIRLLTKAEIIKLFPNAIIYEEKFWGLKKSFVAYTQIRRSS
jgi:hypothetical protein